MNITTREYKKSDFKPLLKIIREAWHYDDFCNPETADILASVFLSSCLTNHTFSKVAVYNEKPVGIILANNKSKHKCPLSLRIQQLKYLFMLLISSEGRYVSSIFRNIENIDKQLLKNCKSNYSAEIALFAIDKSCRGKGIGKTLFQSAIEYLTDEKVENFYLFTDTSCNYGFYEHYGMSRRCEQESRFSMKKQVVDMKFFVYDYTL